MYNFHYNTTNWHTDRYHLHIDVNEAIAGLAIVKGWFINKSDADYIVKVTDQKGTAIDAISYGKNRPKLGEMYPEITNSSHAGFEINTKKFQSNCQYFINILISNNDSIQVGSFVTIAPLLYIHIAKTAGSTVNKVLQDCFGNSHSLIHVESKNNWHELIQQQQINFLSGHIPYKAFLKVKGVQCYKKAITFREPHAHVTSHLSWIRALSLPVNREKYAVHPKYIRDLSDKLATYDFSQHPQIRQLIGHLSPQEFRLLDNTQTRYIRTEIGKPMVTEIDTAHAVENLKDFDFVGTDNNISGFLDKITKEYGFKNKDSNRRENMLKTTFGLDKTDKKTRDALLPLIQHDLELYKQVRKDFP